METIRTGRELLLLLLLSSSTVCFGDDQSEKAHNHFRQGLAYQQEGKFNEAIAEYEQSAALEPTSGNAMFNLGLIYFKQQRWPQAIEAFQRASELDPEDGGATSTWPQPMLPRAPIHRRPSSTMIDLRRWAIKVIHGLVSGFCPFETRTST